MYEFDSNNLQIRELYFDPATDKVQVEIQGRIHRFFCIWLDREGRRVPTAFPAMYYDCNGWLTHSRQEAITPEERWVWKRIWANVRTARQKFGGKQFLYAYVFRRTDDEKAYYFYCEPDPVTKVTADME